ncbi:hypothetical protein KAX35_01950 [candidate division WOR-3 bacterium]|nr:hypothetical protein [candidate division WOR-3 bacterium]MCK4329211.1 hypothetical protein [candidate division WOR-3 bacterium]
MRSKKELKKMFTEIGLGTEKKREKFLKLEEKELEATEKKQIFIRLDISTHAIKGGGNA